MLFIKKWVLYTIFLFFPLEEHLLIAQTDPLYVWEWKSGQIKRTKTTNGRATGNNLLAFSSEDKLLAAIFEGTKIQVWNMQTGQRLPLILDGLHYNLSSIIFYDRDRYILAVNDFGEFLLWNLKDHLPTSNNEDAKTGEVRILPPTINPVRFTDDGIHFSQFTRDTKYLATSNGTTTAIWEVQNLIVVGNRPVKPFQEIQQEKVYSIAFSGDGKFLALGREDKIDIRKRSTSTRKWEFAFPLEDRIKWRVVKLSFLTNTKFLLSADLNKKIFLWNLESRQSRMSDGSGNHILSVAGFYYNYKDIHVCWIESDSLLFFRCSNLPKKENYPHSPPLLSVKFSTTGQRFAVQSQDGQIHIYAKDGKQIVSLLSINQKEWICTASKEDKYKFSPFYTSSPQGDKLIELDLNGKRSLLAMHRARMRKPEKIRGILKNQ